MQTDHPKLPRKFATPQVAGVMLGSIALGVVWATTHGPWTALLGGLVGGVAAYFAQRRSVQRAQPPTT
jgi:hypothetical protein